MGSSILSSSTEEDDLGSGKLLSKETLRDSSILIVSLLSTINYGVICEDMLKGTYFEAKMMIFEDCLFLTNTPYPEKRYDVLAPTLHKKTRKTNSQYGVSNFYHTPVHSKKNTPIRRTGLAKYQKQCEYELDEELLKELRSNTYSGRVEEDVVDRIAEILEILDLIKIAGAAGEWFKKDCIGPVTSWEDLVENGHEECRDDPTHEQSICKIKRFKMMKYSFNADEEYIAIKEFEYLSHSKDNLTLIRTFLRILDKGWVMATPKKNEWKRKGKSSNLTTAETKSVEQREIKIVGEEMLGALAIRMGEDLVRHRDLPYVKKAIGTKWVYRNIKDEERSYCQKIKQGLSMSYQMDVKSAFHYGKIDEESLCVCNHRMDTEDGPDIFLQSVLDLESSKVPPKQSILPLVQRSLHKMPMKKLKQVLKIHTDDNVADLLTKAFRIYEIQEVHWVFKSHLEVRKDDIENTEGKCEFHEVIYLLAGSSIHHASHFSLARPESISEASIRSDLLFDDAGGNHGDQAKEIKHLKAQIKKLKRQVKPVITHHKAWMKSVSLKIQCLSDLDEMKYDNMDTEDAQRSGEDKNLSECRQIGTNIRVRSKDSTDNEEEAKAVSREKEKELSFRMLKSRETRPYFNKITIDFKPLPKIEPKRLRGKKKIEEEDEYQILNLRYS
ncbi:hypothetical protein Tco_1218015 [Tanacetum coccineum]